MDQIITCACVEEVQKYSANPRAVFTNNEFSLKYINVYGFDLDYTLVQYSSELHKFAYEHARNDLITKLNVSGWVFLRARKTRQSFKESRVVMVGGVTF